MVLCGTCGPVGELFLMKRGERHIKCRCTTAQALGLFVKLSAFSSIPNCKLSNTVHNT